MSTGFSCRSRPVEPVLGSNAFPLIPVRATWAPYTPWKWGVLYQNVLTCMYAQRKKYTTRAKEVEPCWTPYSIYIMWWDSSGADILKSCINASISIAKQRRPTSYCAAKRRQRKSNHLHGHCWRIKHATDSFVWLSIDVIFSEHRDSEITVIKQWVIMKPEQISQCCEYYTFWL